MPRFLPGRSSHQLAPAFQRKLSGALVLLALVVGDIAHAESPDASGSWPVHGRTAAEQRYSPLDQINKENVKGVFTYDDGGLIQQML